MTRKQIEDLIKFVRKTGVSEVSIETKEFKINIKNDSRKPDPVLTQVTAPHAVLPVAVPVVPTAVTPNTTTVPPKPELPKPSDDSKLHIIKSPMIGTFYRSPSPDKPNFVNVGDEVKPGKPICIIEAMKLFNEIECDVSGRIVKVLVDNSTPVEYDQPLFLVEPS